MKIAVCAKVVPEQARRMVFLTGGAFTPEVLQTMAEINDRPIVFALSNPTSKAECSAEEAYRHTGGHALFACGSPYDPVNLDGKTFVPRQGNNSYIFPGVGLGATACGARLVTDEMFMVAAHALAQLVSEEDLAQGSLYPALPRIREASAHIALPIAGATPASDSDGDLRGSPRAHHQARPELKKTASILPVGPPTLHIRLSL